MKALGDAMGDAEPAMGPTGWPSDLGWELGDITGATEDWNYFAQGTYGYTPEARGPDFHANFATMVVAEYNGATPRTTARRPRGVPARGRGGGRGRQPRRDRGHRPARGDLTLHKEFDSPTVNQPLLNVDEVLHTTLTAPPTAPTSGT